jgi:acylphosphatase
MENEISRMHAIVEGRVQGVGFRYYVVDMAQSLGVSGWVRNRWDDTVEVIAEGNRDILEKLLAGLRRGPRAAYVSNVQVDWEPATGEFKSFWITQTD